jgi:hypothetical protein
VQGQVGLGQVAMVRSDPANAYHTMYAFICQWVDAGGC